MEEDLVALLLADAGLTALVGTRIKWLLRPQGSALPAITLQLAAGGRDYHFGGRSDLSGPLIQMDVWAATFASMKAVERALLTALDAITAAPFQGAFVESERETTETQDGPDATGSTTFYRASKDVRVWSHA